MSGQDFPAGRRVKKLKEFQAVYAAKCYAADSVLVVQLGYNQLSTCRLGLSVSRKVGNAVVRNRWKRLVREAFRRQWRRFPQGVDIVVRPRKGARPDAALIAASLPPLVRRAHHHLQKR